MTEKEMWKLCCEKNKIDENVSYEAWAFCGGGPLADELAELVLEGRKTATASTLIAYEVENDPIPKTGCYNVILFDNGEAACVIRDTKVSVIPFDEVSKEHAYKEGENGRTLREWREVHKKTFTPDYHAAGKEFEEKGLCVLEEFERVYP